MSDCETIEEDQISNWLEADDSEIELTDQETVNMVREPVAPDAEMTHKDFSRVAADNAFRGSVHTQFFYLIFVCAKLFPDSSFLQ